MKPKKIKDTGIGQTKITQEEFAKALGAEPFNRVVCTGCGIISRGFVGHCEHVQKVIEDERKYLAKEVCPACKGGTELVKDVAGHYAHRIKDAKRGDWVDNCYAAEIHDLLVTEAYQMKEEDEGA